MHSFLLIIAFLICNRWYDNIENYIGNNNMWIQKPFVIANQIKERNKPLKTQKIDFTIYMLKILVKNVYNWINLLTFAVNITFNKNINKLIITHSN